MKSPSLLATALGGRVPALGRWTRPVAVAMLRRYAAGGVSVAAVLALAFPGSYFPIRPGVDESMMYLLNVLAQSERIFGPDATSTFGPLGYLLFPLNVGPNLLHGIVFRLLVHALLAGCLMYFVWARPRSAVPLFAVSYLIVRVLGFGQLFFYEYELLVPVVLLAAIAIEDNSPARVSGAVLASYSAVLLMVKFSLGVAAAGTMAIVAGAQLLTQGRAALSRIGIMAAAYAGSVVVLIVTYFQSAANLLTWVSLTGDLAAEYGVAMSIVGPVEQLWLGLAALAGYVVVTGLLFARRSRLSYVAILWAGPLLVAFKHGFVRQDGHVLVFFLLLPVALSTMILCSRGRRDLRVAVVSFLIALLIALPIAAGLRAIATHAAEPLKTSHQNIRAVLNPSVVRALLDADSTAVLQRDRLPADWVELIKKNQGTVDVLPFELVYCPANGLTCKPNPMMQVYLAYTDERDRLSAQHYAGPDSPDFLIVDYWDIDGRHPLLSTPATWRMILENYAVVDAQQRNDSTMTVLPRALLKRTGATSARPLTTLRQQTMTTNEWISVPPSTGVLFADVVMNLNFRGRVAKTAFRVPPVQLEVRYQQGHSAAFRVSPDTLRNGVLISHLPLTAGEFAQFVDDHRQAERVAAFRITGPGTAYYPDGLGVTWKEWLGAAPLPAAKLELPALPQAGPTIFVIDALNATANPIQAGRVVVDSAITATVELRGWALDVKSGKAPAAVYLTVDDTLDFKARSGLPRPDVADHFKNSGFLNSGFSVSVPVASFTKGVHRLSLKVVNTEATGYYVPAQHVTIEIR